MVSADRLDMTGFVSHPRIVPGTVEERKYQLSMSKGCISESTLIILPTGLGKTVVALLTMADILEKRGRVLVLAPTKPLVDQHASFFSENLRDTTVAAVTGNMAPEKRKSVVTSKDVIVSTPQAVSNDLMNGIYDLSGFSLVVYDEAHRGTGNYAYVHVSRRYDGLALGMTASPGSDIERMDEVCRNLSLRRIDMRSEYDPDVSPYVYDVNVERIEVNMPKDLTDVISLLKILTERYAAELTSLRLMDPNWPPSTKHLLTVGRNLQARLANGEKTSMVFRGLTLQSMCIKTLHAVSLAETQGMSALKNYLLRIQTEASKKDGGKGSKEIVASKEFLKVWKIASESRVEHPKVSRVMTLVSRTLGSDKGAKVLIFTQYRDTCDLLVDKLSSVGGARVGKLIGQANGGLKQKEQIEMLDMFRDSRKNVIVATSVGEEGLDIANTDTVIFYEPVPSEIRTIQRRGRTGRKDRGKVYVLVAKGTVDEVFEESSRKKELLMRSRLERLSRGLSGKKTPVVKQRALSDF